MEIINFLNKYGNLINFILIIGLGIYVILSNKHIIENFAIDTSTISAITNLGSIAKQMNDSPTGTFKFPGTFQVKKLIIGDDTSNSNPILWDSTNKMLKIQNLTEFNNAISSPTQSQKDEGGIIANGIVSTNNTLKVNLKPLDKSVIPKGSSLIDAPRKSRNPGSGSLINYYEAVKEDNNNVTLAVQASPWDGRGLSVNNQPITNDMGNEWIFW